MAAVQYIPSLIHSEGRERCTLATTQGQFPSKGVTLCTLSQYIDVRNWCRRHNALAVDVAYNTDARRISHNDASRLLGFFLVANGKGSLHPEKSSKVLLAYPPLSNVLVL